MALRGNIQLLLHILLVFPQFKAKYYTLEREKVAIASILEHHDDKSILSCQMSCNRNDKCVKIGVDDGSFSSGKGNCYLLQRYDGDLFMNTKRTIHLSTLKEKPAYCQNDYQNKECCTTAASYKEKTGSVFSINFKSVTTKVPFYMKQLQADLNSFGVSVWVKIKDHDYRATLFTVSYTDRQICNGLVIRCEATKKLTIISEQLNLQTNIDLNPETWTHITVIWDGEMRNLRLFINGAYMLSTEKNSSSIYLLQDRSLQITLGNNADEYKSNWCRPANHHEGFVGLMTQFHVWHQSVINLTESKMLDICENKLTHHSLIGLKDFQNNVNGDTVVIDNCQSVSDRSCARLP